MSGVPAIRTIDDVIAGLTIVIDECRTRESRIGYFASLYRRITIAIKAAIAEGKFEDGARMERLDVVFASRYLDTIAKYHEGRKVDDVWEYSFRAARLPTPTVMQHLLMAVNAHVDYDLGIAAATVCPGASIAGLKNDFFTLNAILAGQVDTVRRELCEINVLLRLTDLFGWLEDRLVDQVVDVGRNHAWNFATQLAAASPEQHQALIDADARETMRISRDVLYPGILTPVVWFIRIFERGNVREKIDFLARE